MDKQIASVYETYDYDKFHIMEKGNREIDHYKKIATQMNEQFLFTVIIVNEKFEIIDGQNRFLASKELHKPIRYIIVEGYGVEQVRMYNMEARNWQKKDFVKSYADEGKKEYVKMMEFQKRYPDFPISICEFFLRMSLTCDYDKKRHLNHSAIPRGLFVIKDFETSCKLADMVIAYKPFCENQSSPIYRRREFVAAIIKLYRCEDFDNELVLKKIKLNPRAFTPCVNSDDYIRMIEDIVNFRSRNKVRFNVYSK